MYKRQSVTVDNGRLPGYISNGNGSSPVKSIDCSYFLATLLNLVLPSVWSTIRMPAEVSDLLSAESLAIAYIERKF